MKKIIIAFLFLLLVGLLVGTVAATSYLIRAPPDPALLNNAGYQAYESGDEKVAEAFFKASIALAPQYERARYNLALLYFKQGRYDEAQPLFDKLIRLKPGNAKYHFDGAANYVAKFRKEGVATKSDFEHAIAEYRTADKLSPGFPNALSNAKILSLIEDSFS